MTVRTQSVNNVTTFNITGHSHHSALPDWLARKNAKALKKDPLWARRITLIQDFSFPEASLKILFTPDNSSIVACGVYKPQLKCFDLQEMACKFERHTVAETVDVVALGESWDKLALLQADRSVEFHGRSGVYYNHIRTPRQGRSMAYDAGTADLVIGGSGPEVWRVSLDRGQFLAPLATGLAGVNGVAVGPGHGLYGLAGDGGLVEMWDRRDRVRASRLEGASLDGDMSDMTSIMFTDELHIAVGDSAGAVRIFDLRAAAPTATFDHRYGQPIKGFRWHRGSRTLLSFDSKVCRLTRDNEHLTSITPPVPINDVAVDGESGFIAMAVEDGPIHSFYCPALGPAPRWARYLENVTSEEAVRGATPAVYDNYKFVTRPQLHDLGLSHLIGNGHVLKAYMHGYFVDLRLYEKARAIANPFALDEYREAQARKKLEAERASRICAQTRAKPGRKAVTDERFRRTLQEDPDFQMDGLQEARALEHHRKAANKQ